MSFSRQFVPLNASNSNSFLYVFTNVSISCVTRRESKFFIHFPHVALKTRFIDTFLSICCHYSCEIILSSLTIIQTCPTCLIFSILDVRTGICPFSKKMWMINNMIVFDLTAWGWVPWYPTFCFSAPPF